MAGSEGQPIRFIQYHVLRSPELRAKTIQRNRRGASAEQRRKQSESMKGKLVEELHPAWKGEQAKQSAKHNWLQRHYPKTGICEDCGQQRLTHYSFLHHPGAYTRRREDYAERCVPCHRMADNALRRKLGTRRLVPAA